MIIAITGYIGTGKTTAAGAFKEKGWNVINVDELGHELLDKPEVKHRLLAKFGSDIADRQMNIDREKLGKAAFSDDASLAFLDKTMHPVMAEELKNWVGGLRGDILIDAALYTKLGIDKLAEKVILITADVDKLFSRLSPRYTPEQVIRIMNSQEQPDADYTIENNGSMEQFLSRIEELADRLHV
jgi:dephospho-CoA kinase